jgi:hypothetical protein
LETQKRQENQKNMKRNILLSITAAALVIAPAAFCQSASQGTTMNMTVGPEATFTSVDASTTIQKSDTIFGSFTGTTNFTYKIRTTQTSGSGSITVQIVAFQTNGPATSDVSYTCTAPTSGTPCASSTGASTSAATSVVVFGADVHSGQSGDSGTAVWTIVDKTATKTGTYSSLATYTIAAL